MDNKPSSSMVKFLQSTASSRARRVACGLLLLAFGPASQLAIADDPSRPVSDTPLARVQWHPSGQQVTYIRRVVKGEISKEVLFGFDVDTATETVLLDPDAAQAPAGAQRAGWNLYGYQWSPAGDALLLNGDNDLWFASLATKSVRRLTEDGAAEETPLFSPDGRRVAFVRHNNLFVVDVASGTATPLTNNGSETILNGKLDWVYGEELQHLTGTNRAFEWSPDGRQVVYLRLDQARVPEHPLVDILQTHPEVRRQRYPKAGDANSVPALFVALLDDAAPVVKSMPLAAQVEYVLPEFTWTPDGKTVHVMTLNRGQNELTVQAWNPSAGSSPRVLLEERDAAWLNIFEGPRFLKKSTEFVWLSERDGWLHAYLFDAVAGERRQLTRGPWQIEPMQSLSPLPRPFEWDPAEEWGYFSATEADPRERQIYRVRLDGFGFERLTHEPGTHVQRLAPDGRHLLDEFSSVDQPPATRLLRADGTVAAVLYQSQAPTRDGTQPTREFHDFLAADGTRLYGRLTKPADFDPAKKYPIIVDIYGGPQLQVVRNAWGHTSTLHQRLLKAGFLIWSLDNRGSWGRGHAWESSVFKNLGAKELADQLEGLAYLKTLPFVDGERFGLRGWSYGGYMTAYALTHAPDAFKCGVAGAPVTDWKFYDSIYTERYMRTPAENPDGYKSSSPVAAAAQLKAKLLLIHGTADDNVHVQNTLTLVDALIRAEKMFELQIQPGQGHGFGGAAAQHFLLEQVVAFFERNL